MKSEVEGKSFMAFVKCSISCFGHLRQNFFLSFLLFTPPSIMWGFMFLSLLLCFSLSHAFTLHFNDNSSSDVDTLYSTLGVPLGMCFFKLLDFPLSHFSTFLYILFFSHLNLPDIKTQYNITFINQSNFKCDFHNINVTGKFVVYTEDIFEEYNIFRKCFNHFMDEACNGGYFSKKADEAGALGVLMSRSPLEKMVIINY